RADPAPHPGRPLVGGDPAARPAGAARRRPAPARADVVRRLGRLAAHPPAGTGRDLAYWRETLDGLPDVLDLPADRPRPAVRHNAGRRLLFDLDDKIAGAVRALAAE